MDKTKEKKENSFQRFIEAAKPFKSGYILSVVTALLGVACRVLPFIFISQIIVALFSGEHSFSVYITYLALMAISYILETVFSGISVNISHSTCYKTLAAIRTSVLEKMFTLPLGHA